MSRTTQVLGQVREALRCESRLDLRASPINSAVDDGGLTMERAVPSVAERDMAESDTWYLFGVDRVINDIGVRPG